MKDHLLEIVKYNHWANQRIVEVISQLDEELVFLIPLWSNVIDIKEIGGFIAMDINPLLSIFLR